MAPGTTGALMYVGEAFEPDARLFAAAPELLAISRRICELAESGDLPLLKDWVEMAQLRSAIAKAEGAI